MTKRSFLLIFPVLALAAFFSAPVGAESSSLEILKFEATWCGPCQKMKPIFRDVSKELASRASFRSIDVDEQPDLAQAYKIELLPTVVAVKNGEVVGRSTGFMNAAKLKSFVKKHQ
ncbi:MAG: thioredoxin fold domain-containing protein [Verrucomicrobiaceae bacterium]|nr:thioredoxin fold domain-containing protein [Verrucomicrobiaceae bacterium]